MGMDPWSYVAEDKHRLRDTVSTCTENKAGGDFKSPCPFLLPLAKLQQNDFNQSRLKLSLAALASPPQLLAGVNSAPRHQPETPPGPVEGKGRPVPPAQQRAGGVLGQKRTRLGNEAEERGANGMVERVSRLGGVLSGTH